MTYLMDSFILAGLLEVTNLPIIFSDTVNTLKSAQVISRLDHIVSLQESGPNIPALASTFLSIASPSQGHLP